MNEEWKKDLIQEFINIYTGNDSKKEKAYTNIGYFYQCKAPASLYKYFSDKDEKLNMVINNRMWYSAPICFNDPFDCSFSTDSKAMIRCFIQNNSANVEINEGSIAWKTIEKSILDGLPELEKAFLICRESTGVASFSEQEDSLLMWAHYANNHKGFCVEYSLWDFVEKLQFTPVPVLYDNQKPILTRLSLDSAIVNEFFLKCLFSKSIEWQYEKEWRIIRDSGAAGNRWNRENYGAELDSVTPKSIILGCNSDPSFVEKVKTACNIKGIAVYQMCLGEKEYKLKKGVIQ